MPRVNAAKPAVASPAILTGNSATAKAKKATEAKAAKDRLALENAKGFDDKPITAPKRSGQVVTIGCKISGGFRLDFHIWREVQVPVVGGGVRVSKEAMVDATQRPIFLRGPSVPYGHVPDYRIVKGAAMTSGVSADLWDRWCKDNSTHPALINHQIFAAPTEDAAIGMAKDYAGELSGLQAMEPDLDKRIPKKPKRKRGRVVGMQNAIESASTDGDDEMTGCIPAPVVTFDYAEWTAMFPEFSTVPQGTAQGYFMRATLLCSNKLGPVCTPEELKGLLYLLTAHLAAIYSDTQNPANPAASNTPVGRLASATEGSVSGSWDNQYPPGTPQWYQQTKYGAEYWAATAQYRTFRYRSGIRPGLGLSQIPWLYSNNRN